MTLFLLERELDTNGERQNQLDWKSRSITDADGNSTGFAYLDLESIDLKAIDQHNLRPLYSAKVCQLQFCIPIEVEIVFLHRNII